MEKVQSKGKLKNLLFDHKGMTLIEAMGGLVILALTLVLIYSGFLTAQKVINHGDALEEQSQDAYASIEQGKASPGEEDTVNVTLGGPLSFTGKYSEIEDEETNTGLYTFQSTTTPSTHNLTVADEVRNTFISYLNIFKSMTQQERVDAGYPRYITNSDCREWIFHNVYGDTWPTMGTNLYVQPYYYVRTDGTADVFVYASYTTGENNWYGDNWDQVRYIYDHEEHVWYCTQWYGWYGYYTYDITNKSWPTVKKEIHTYRWYALN